MFLRLVLAVSNLISLCGKNFVEFLSFLLCLFDDLLKNVPLTKKSSKLNCLHKIISSRTWHGFKTITFSILSMMRPIFPDLTFFVEIFKTQLRRSDANSRLNLKTERLTVHSSLVDYLAQVKKWKNEPTHSDCVLS